MIAHSDTQVQSLFFGLSVTHASHSQGLVTTVKSECAFIPAMTNVVNRTVAC